FEILHAGVDRLVVVCPKDHPLARGRGVKLEALARVPLVLTAPGTSVRAVVDAAFENSGYIPEIACEPTYMMTAVAMVRGGLGVTILPSTAREVLAEPGLVARPISERSFVRPVTLIKKRGRTLPPLTEKFVAAVKKKIGATATRRLS
ncbi:MAG TPA: LysR substrate-binding domain-containing protein, partial [Paraburkholderia sp.]